MQSILITSKNKRTALEKGFSLCKEFKIADLDINVENFEKAIGIEDIRNIQKKLFLKPLRSNIKAVIIDSFHGITLEAQNSLLKALEEPPINTIILIISNNKNLFLSTILSRCKILEIREKFSLSNSVISDCQKNLKEILEAGVGKKFKLAQSYSQNKEDTLIWLEQMLIAIRKLIIDETISSNGNKSISYLNILKNFQKTYTIIKTSNVNQRFALEDLFLKI